MRCNKIMTMGLACALLSTTLSACATTRTALTPGTAGLGDAVAHNMDAQKVAPTDAQKRDTFIPANQARKALARAAYETDSIDDIKAPSGKE